MSHWNQLHDESVVIDLHSHPALKAMLFGRDLTIDNKRKFLMKKFGDAFWPATTRSDFPKMLKGGLNTALSTVYVPEQGWLEDFPSVKLLKYILPSGWRRLFKPSYFQATIDSLDEIERQVTQAQKKNMPVAVVKNVGELNKALKKKKLAVIHSVEGAHSLQGNECGKIVEDPNNLNTKVESEILTNLEILHNRGVAYLTLAHFYPNCCVESPCFPYPEYALKFAKWRKAMTRWDHTKGLSAIGEVVVEKMLDLGMLIDITHLTPPARSRVYEIVESNHKQHRVFASHLGVYGVNNDPCNLADWELRWLADHGGTLGVIFMNYWLSPVDTKLGLKYIMKTINHIHDVAGASCISLGTDFDGMTDPPDEITSMADLPLITRELVSMQLEKQRRYTDWDITSILGGNAYRLLQKGWRGPR